MAEAEPLRDRLDPELRRGLDRLLGFIGPGGMNAVADIAERRALLARMAQAVAARSPADPTVVITKATAAGHVGPDVALRIYRPAGVEEPLPIVCYLHAGGMVMGAPSHEDRMAADVARDVGCVVVAPAYRLAPEHPYPAALEDVETTLRWVHEQTHELGGDPDRVALYGRSAGGGLAAAATLRARASGGPHIAFQLLAYPMLDDRNATPSSHVITDLGIWDRGTNLEAWRWALGGLAEAADVPETAAPARATDLSGLPPAFIDTGELDLFRDEDIAYASRLLEHGVAVELHVYPGAYHAFEEVTPEAAVSRQAQATRIAALRRVLHS